MKTERAPIWDDGDVLRYRTFRSNAAVCRSRACVHDRPGHWSLGSMITHALAVALVLAATPVAAADDWVLRPAEHLMWKRTVRDGSAEAYWSYLSLYWRDGKHVAEAFRRWVELTHPWLAIDVSLRRRDRNLDPTAFAILL
jgi:hypothetical protein